MQQRIADGKGSRNCNTDLCERARKGTPWFWSNNVLCKSFLESEAGWQVIDKNHRTLNILKFKQSSGRNEDLLGVKEDEANEQHTSIVKALKAATPEWTFEQMNFVARWCGGVVEDDFYNKLERLSVQAGKKTKILAAHVRRICKAHDTVIRSYYQQINGSGRLGLTRLRRWRTSENRCMC